MKKDYLVVLMISLVIFGGGYLIHLKSTNGLTSNVKEEVINNEFASNEVNKNVHFTYDNTKQLKTTNYTLQQVYDSIAEKKGQVEIQIPQELNDIYQNFYDYFEGSNLFYNVYGESYDYDEYMFIHTYSKLKNNSEMFGLYLINYTKCLIFSNVSNNERVEMTKQYCSEEPHE